MAADYTAADRAHDQRLNDLEIAVALLLRERPALLNLSPAELDAVRVVGDRALNLKHTS